MNVLERFHDAIDEVRIEGHTSSRWRLRTDADRSYFFNMGLSQSRTLTVLSYVYNLPEVIAYRPWIKSNVAAVGLSSSRLILNSQGFEDEKRSRRVTFRVLTNADEQIKKIEKLEGG